MVYIRQPFSIPKASIVDEPVKKIWHGISAIGVFTGIPLLTSKQRISLPTFVAFADRRARFAIFEQSQFYNQFIRR